MKQLLIKSKKLKLDRIFSRYIRLRDCDENGFGKCISCGRFRKLQAGHWIKRQHMSTRFSEVNVSGQCSYCNHWLHGNEVEYEQALIKKYGQGAVNKLLAAKRITAHYGHFEYDTMIAEFQQKTKILLHLNLHLNWLDNSPTKAQ